MNKPMKKRIVPRLVKKPETLEDSLRHINTKYGWALAKLAEFEANERKAGANPASPQPPVAGVSPPEPRIFSREQIDAWIAKDEADMRRFGRIEGSAR